jgi:hypothetical protein
MEIDCLQQWAKTMGQYRTCCERFSRVALFIADNFHAIASFSLLPLAHLTVESFEPYVTILVQFELHRRSFWNARSSHGSETHSEVKAFPATIEELELPQPLQLPLIVPQ